MSEALARAGFPKRKRRPKKGTEALIAVYLVAKPQDEAHRKACSAYAKILLWAAAKQVEPDHFVEEFAKVDLAKCTAFVRDRRKRSKAKATTPANPQDASPLGTHVSRDHEPPEDKRKLIIIVRDEAGADQSREFMLSPEHHAALLAVLAREAEFDSEFHVLNALLASLRKADLQNPPLTDTGAVGSIQ